MAANDNPTAEVDGTTSNIAPLIHPDCEKKSLRATSIINENVDVMIEKNNEKGFLLDIIVVRLDIPNKTITDKNKLFIDVNFNGKNSTITSSCINVLDFKPERSLEFFANPSILKDELSKNPLKLKIIEGENILGYGRFDWPVDFLCDLIDRVSLKSHLIEMEIKEYDGTKIGTIQIILQLQPKCEEYIENTSLDSKCRNANKEIYSADVLFVVGRDRNPCCCCSQIGIIPSSESDHALNPKCLDLSNFRAVNSQNVNNVDILGLADYECQNLKLINAVKSEGQIYNKNFVDENDEIFHKQASCDSNCNVLKTSSDYCCMPLYCRSDNKDFSAKNIIQTAHESMLPELIENKPDFLRWCPLCKENITFLPKLATCPNCCYKPVPYFEEKPYNDVQSAEQILKEFQNNLQADDNLSSNLNLKEDAVKCRCTCKYGSTKPCANCRIRKLCEDIFKPLSPPSTSPAVVCEVKSSDINCASSDSRPFLTRIFSELKDLYNIKEPKKKVFELDKRCEIELNKMPTKKSKSEQSKLKKEVITGQNMNNSYEQKEERTKSRKYGKRKRQSLKPEADKAVKSKLYDYETIHRNSVIHIGHKTCMNGFTRSKNVPPNMGWLWNIHRSGKWKPGAICKPIKELMRYFLKDFPADTLLVSQYSYRKTSKTKNHNSSLPILAQKPTLHIHKQNGEYIITMRPLKSAEVLKDAADPYENMKPIQFRIIKNPKLEEIRKIKQCLKEMGFKKCTCHKPIIFCYCRSFLEKKKLEYQCNKECCKRQINSCCDTLVLSDTSDSEAEFNFAITPPAGIIKPEKFRKVNLVNVSTQYEESDWNWAPLFPRPPNKYMQMYQCAIGNRNSKSIEDGTENTTDKTKRGGLYVPGTVGTGYGRGSKTRSYDVGGSVNVIRGRGAGGGDDTFYSKGNPKGGVVNINFSGKYGGHPTSSDKNINKKEDAHARKVDMMKYTMNIFKKNLKMSPAEAATKRKEKMHLLKGVNPPLLCTVDRRGKPLNICDSSFPCNDNRIC